MSQNVDWNQVRIQASIAAMQGYLNGLMGDRLLMEQNFRAAKKEGCKSIGEFVAIRSVGFADALVEELKKEKGI